MRPHDLEAARFHIFPQKNRIISFRGRAASAAECWSAAAESADWRYTCLSNKNVVLNIAQRIWNIYYTLLKIRYSRSNQTISQ